MEIYVYSLNHSYFFFLVFLEIIMYAFEDL